MLKPEIQAAYIAILNEELVPATGCTEPIAVAYAAAKLRQVLGSSRNGCGRRSPATSSRTSRAWWCPIPAA